MAHLLTGLRLLLAVPTTLAFARAELWSPGLLLACVVIAIATDFCDGIIARRTKTASPGGRLFDHATDFLFVTSGLAGAAVSGDVTFALPVLIVVAFSLYALDTYYLHREKRLRMSVLGRWNGIAYFVPLVLVSASRLGSLEGLAGVLDASILVVSYGLVLSTVASIIDRAVAPLSGEQHRIEKR